jgi:hypothetical protein
LTLLQGNGDLSFAGKFGSSSQQRNQPFGQPSAEEIDRAEADEFADVFARIEAHYFVNKGFFREDGWILKKEQIDKIRHIPCTIVQGRYDLVCPYYTAYKLKQEWPEAEFVEIAECVPSSFTVSFLDANVALGIRQVNKVSRMRCTFAFVSYYAAHYPVSVAATDKYRGLKA